MGQIMRIKKITICNLGPFENTNKITLNDFDDIKNISVFGGNNGSGKTTLFNLIQIGIFGAKSEGFITNNQTYISKIKTLINNNALKKNKEAFIRIEFDYNNNFSINRLVIERSWSLPEIKEKVYLKKNNEELKSTRKYNTLNEIYSLFPPKLLNINLFDGEKINEMTQNSELYDYIEEIIEFYFNLDLISSLENDLTKYIQNINENELNSDEIKLKKNLADISSNKILVKRLNYAIKNNDKKIESYQDKYNSLLNQIKESNIISESLKNKILDEKYNQDRIYKQSLNELLSELSEKAIIIYFGEELRSLVNKYKENIEKKFEYEKNLLLGNSNQNYEFYYDLSVKQVIDIDSQLSKYDHKKTNIKLKDFEKIHLSRSKIEHSLKTSKTSELTGKLFEIETAITDLREENSINIKEVEKHLEILEVLQMNNKAIKKDIINSNRTNNSLSVVESYIGLLNEFKTDELSNITERISELISEDLKDTSHLQYEKISINPSKRIIQLTVNNKDIDLKKLSAGERQMLFLMIFQKILSVSNLDYPVILDTPIARLDKSNKSLFLDIIKKINTQVLIFSTDREFDNSLIKSFEDRLSSIHLISKKSGKSRIIEKKYFGEEK